MSAAHPSGSATPDPWALARWRGQWIWDKAPSEEAFWWKRTASSAHFTYLRCAFQANPPVGAVPARVTCDSRYVLYLNGVQIGRGPVRGEPEFLAWDEYDLGPVLLPGSNVLVALCCYYGAMGPWWVPAAPLGTLGRGSFCFETAADSPVEVVSGSHWRAVAAPWIPSIGATLHAFPPEIVDGKALVAALHDPAADESQWPLAATLSGGGHGTVLDRPPAAPYISPLRRPIPPLTSTLKQPRRRLHCGQLRLEVEDDPRATWATHAAGQNGSREVSVWDMGEITLGHVRLTVRPPISALANGFVDLVVGEELDEDGLPEIRPRSWAVRYLVGAQSDQEITFFDPVGLRYLAAHYAPGIDVAVAVEESIYPRPTGAEFECDDAALTRQWQVGARTVDVCSSDALMDCPGREQRAWVADAYVEILVSLVTNPDTRLVKHHLQLTSRSRFPDGLLAGAAACDFAHSGLPTPEYSLHWIRELAAYWLYTADEGTVRELRPVAEAIIARYERQRGSSGLLEDFPGWVFLDWAQVQRDVVIGAHDALYAAALRAYSHLPGASDVSSLLGATTSAYEQLWDPQRRAYVDSIGATGPGRRLSQHTNAGALLAGIVPGPRVQRLIDRITDPTASGDGGRLVVTAYPGSLTDPDLIPNFQYQPPADFDEERDVVAAQPWFCRFLHEAFFVNGRTDLILRNLQRWPDDDGNGTFPEFWESVPGRSSRCHGWSASPTYDLTSHVLGMRPTHPGFARAVFEPQLGHLARASGCLPTPHGWLSASVNAERVHLQIPAGVVVEFAGKELSEGTHEMDRARQ